MGIVSAAAFAEAPTLKATNFGQEIEIDNTSGGVDIGQAVMFANTLGLAYGDWSFSVTGAKFWSLDTDKGTDSVTGRLQLDAWRKINDELKLGARYRGEQNFDRYQLRYAYEDNMLWTTGDVWYQANTNEAVDNIEVEWFPIGVKYGAFKAGWFINYWKNAGSVNNGDKTENIEHQVRMYANLYKGEKLSVDAEARITLNNEKDYKGPKADVAKTVDNTEFDSLGRYRVYLGGSYALTENLSVYGKYGYELGEKDYYANGKECNDGKYYGEFVAGWNYKF